MPSPLYPFDPTGLNALNLAPAEIHVVAAAAGKNIAFIVPRAAPFFSASIKVRNGTAPNSPLMVQGVDYILTHRFEEACLQTSKQVYGSIAFLNRNFSGSVRIDPYQTVGGNWTLDDYSIVEQLTNSLYSIRTVLWTQVVNYPTAFPPYNHDHDADDLTGMVAVVNKLTEVVAAIAAGGPATSALDVVLQQHITANNAHTKAQVGLGNIQNYPIATKAQAEAGTSNALYMTPLRAKELLTAMGGAGAGAARTVTFTGDVTGSASDTAGTNLTMALTLAEALRLLDSNPFTTIASGTTAVNPNTSSETFFVTNHANAPTYETVGGSRAYWFILNMGHSTAGTVTKRMQVAFEYRTTLLNIQRCAIRYMSDTNTWSEWTWISNHQVNRTDGRSYGTAWDSNAPAVFLNADVDAIMDPICEVNIASATLNGLPRGKYILQNYLVTASGTANQLSSAQARIQTAQSVTNGSQLTRYYVPTGTAYWSKWRSTDLGGIRLYDTDINQLFTEGNYDQTLQSTYPNLVALGYPAQANGRLQVTHAAEISATAIAGVTRQRYLVNNTMETWERFHHNVTGWSTWKEVTTAAGNVPVDRLPVIPITKGGTGAITAATARDNLGLGSGATATLVVSPTQPVAPVANTFWFKP